MVILDSETKFAHLGKPGLGFSKGFQRRLDILRKYVNLENKIILDQGCGIGVWIHQFKKFTLPKNVFGFDIDKESIENFNEENAKFDPSEQIPVSNIKVCTAEKLEFGDAMFDFIFSNEVLEHVEDDKKSLEEALRVLKDGGKMIIFTPNRGWPFETHGMFWQNKYVYGNIPFLPWLPKSIYRKFAPHVRNYGHWEIEKLISDINFQNTKFKIQHHKHVFPGFDGAVRRLGVIGKIIQKFFHILEKTPLQFFGISHFIILEKTSK